MNWLFCQRPLWMLLALPGGECHACIRKARAESQAVSEESVKSRPPMRKRRGWQQSRYRAAKILFLLILTQLCQHGERSPSGCDPRQKVLETMGDFVKLAAELPADHGRDPLSHARSSASAADLRLAGTGYRAALPGAVPVPRFLVEKLDGKLHSVRVASVGLIKPAEFRYADCSLTLQCQLGRARNAAPRAY